MNKKTKSKHDTVLKKNKKGFSFLVCTDKQTVNFGGK